MVRLSSLVFQRWREQRDRLCRRYQPNQLSEEKWVIRGAGTSLLDNRLRLLNSGSGNEKSHRKVGSSVCEYRCPFRQRTSSQTPRATQTRGRAPLAVRWKETGTGRGIGHYAFYERRA